MILKFGKMVFITLGKVFLNKDRRIDTADLFPLRKGVSDAQTNLNKQKLQ